MSHTWPCNCLLLLSVICSITYEPPKMRVCLSSSLMWTLLSGCGKSDICLWTLYVSLALHFLSLFWTLDLWIVDMGLSHSVLTAFFAKSIRIGSWIWISGLGTVWFLSWLVFISVWTLLCKSTLHQLPVYDIHLCSGLINSINQESCHIVCSCVPLLSSPVCSYT